MEEAGRPNQCLPAEAFWNPANAQKIAKIFRGYTATLATTSITNSSSQFKDKFVGNACDKTVRFRKGLEKVEAQLKEHLKVFRNYSESHIEESLREGTATVCGRYYKAFDFCARCLECRFENSCVMCMPCFLRSPCRFHNHQYEAVLQSEGMCDCGDIHSWRKESFCALHRSSLDENRDPLAHLSDQKKQLFSTIARGAVQVVAFSLLYLLQEYKLKEKKGRIICSGLQKSILVPLSLPEFVKIIHWLAESGCAGRRLLANAWSEDLDPSFYDEESQTKESSKTCTDSSHSTPNSSFFREVSLRFDDTVVSAFPLHSALEVFFLLSAFQKKKFDLNDSDYEKDAEDSEEDSYDSDDLLFFIEDSPIDAGSSSSSLQSVDSVASILSSFVDIDDTDDESETSSIPEEFVRVLEMFEKAVPRKEKQEAESDRLTSVEFKKYKTLPFQRFWRPITESITKCMSDEVFRRAYGLVQTKYFYTCPSEDNFMNVQVLGNKNSCDALLHSRNFPLIASISGNLPTKNSMYVLPANHSSEKGYRRLTCIQKRCHDNILLRFVGGMLYTLTFPFDGLATSTYQYPPMKDDISCFTTIPTLKRDSNYATIENEVLPFPLINVPFRLVYEGKFLEAASCFSSAFSCSSLVSTIPAVSRLTLRGILVFLSGVSLWSPISGKVDEGGDILFFFKFMERTLLHLHNALSCISQQIFDLATELDKKECRIPYVSWSQRSHLGNKVDHFLEVMQKDFVDEIMEAKKLDDISFPHLPTVNFERMQRLISLQEGENPFLCFDYEFLLNERRGRETNRQDNGVSYTEKIELSTNDYLSEVLQETWRALEVMYDEFFLKLLEFSDANSIKKDKENTVMQTKEKAERPTAYPDQKQKRRDSDEARNGSLNSDAELARPLSDRSSFFPNEEDGGATVFSEKSLVAHDVSPSGITSFIRKYDISRSGAQLPLLPHGPVEHFFANTMMYSVCLQAAQKKIMLEKCRENAATPLVFWRISCCKNYKCTRTLMSTEISSSSFIPSIDETKGEECTEPSSSLETVFFPFVQEENQVPFLAHCPQEYLDCFMDSLVIKFAWGAQVESDGWGGLFSKTSTLLAFGESEEQYLFLLQLLAGVYSPTYFSAMLLDRFTCTSFSSVLQCRVYENFLWLICSIVLTPLPVSLDYNSMQCRIRMLTVHALCAKPLKRSDVHSWVKSKSFFCGLKLNSNLVYDEVESALSEVAVSSGAYLKLKNPEVWRQFVHFYHYSIRDFVLEEVSRSYEQLVVMGRVVQQTTNAKGTGESTNTTPTSSGPASSISSDMSSRFSFASDSQTSIPPVEFHHGEEQWIAPSWHSSRLNLLHTTAVQRICLLLILNHAGKLKDWHGESKILRHFSLVNVGSVGFEKGFLTALHLLYLSVKDAALISNQLKALKRCGEKKMPTLEESDDSIDNINWELVGNFVKDCIRSPRCRSMGDENEVKEKEMTLENVSLFLEVKGNKGEWKWKSAATSAIAYTLPQLLSQPIFVNVENESERIQKPSKKAVEKEVEDHFTLALVLSRLRTYYRNNKESDRFSYSTMIHYILKATQCSPESATFCVDVGSAQSTMTEKRERMENMKARRQQRMMKFLRKGNTAPVPLTVSSEAALDENVKRSGEPQIQAEKRSVEEKNEHGLILSNAPQLVDGKGGDSSKLLSVTFMELLLFKITRERCVFCQRSATSQDPLYLYGYFSQTDVLTRLGYNTTPLTCHFSICGHKAHIACLQKMSIDEEGQCVLCKAHFVLLIPAPVPPSMVRMKKGEYQPMRAEEDGSIHDAWSETDKDTHEVIQQNSEREMGSGGNAIGDEKKPKDILPKKNKKFPIAPFCEDLETLVAFSTTTGEPISPPSSSDVRSSFNQEATYLSFPALVSPAPPSSSDYLPLSRLPFIPPFSYDLNLVDLTENEVKLMRKNFFKFMGIFQEMKNIKKSKQCSEKFLMIPTNEEVEIIDSFLLDFHSNCLENLAIGISQQIQLKMEHLKLNAKFPEMAMEVLFSLLFSFTALCRSFMKEEDKEGMKERKSRFFSAWMLSLSNLEKTHQHFARLILYIVIDDVKRHLYGQDSSSTLSHKAVDVNEHSFFSPEKNIEAFTLALLESDAMKSAVEEILQYSSLAPPSPHSGSVPDTQEELFQSEDSSFPSISERMISLWCSLGSLTILKLLTTWGSGRCSSVVRILWVHSSQEKFSVEQKGDLANFKFITLSNAQHLFSHYSFLLEAILRMMYFLLPLDDISLPRVEGNAPMEDKCDGSTYSQRWVHECLLRLTAYMNARRVERKEGRSDASSSRLLSLRYGSSSNFSIVPVVSLSGDVPSASTRDRIEKENASLSSSILPSAKSSPGSFSLLSWKEHIMEHILHLPREFLTIMEKLYFGDSFDANSSEPLEVFFPPQTEALLREGLPLRCCYCQKFIPALRVVEDNYKLNPFPLYFHALECSGGSGVFLIMHFGVLAHADGKNKKFRIVISPYLNQYKESVLTAINGAYTRDSAIDELICQTWILNQWDKI